MADAVLEAQEIRKVYAPRDQLWRRGERVVALDGVTLSVQAGESVGLVGESGCGKSTLAKILVGLVRPSRGEVRIGRQPFDTLRGPSLRAVRRTVQLVFQDPTNSLNPRMTVEETLAEPLLIHRLAAGQDRRRRIEELLSSVQLPASYLARLPHELSGGERQRVGIARALATDPALLICDEPIASLDVSIGAQILELLRTLRRRRQMALLFISHDLRAVASLCERIVVMQRGRLLEQGPADSLLTHPNHPYTELLLRSADLDLDAVL